MSRLADLTPLQRAAIALEKMQARLDAVERARSEPIAVIGLGIRLPGCQKSRGAECTYGWRFRRSAR